MAKKEKSVLPAIKKKYTIAIIACLLTAIMIPEFLESSFQFPIYLVVVLIALTTFWLMQEWNFRKINKKIRPFVMTRYMQTLSLGLLAAIIIEMAPDLFFNASLAIPYIFFWIIVAIIPLQFTTIFAAANNHKKKYPDRCEFC